MMPARLITSTLCLLLVSCSATRYTASPSAEELTRYVLVLEESPGGQVTEHWRPAEEFDLSWYQFPTSARESTYGRIVHVAKTYQRDCDAENDQCIKMCMRRPLPPGFGHIKSGGRKMGGKEQWCRGQCQQAYNDCRKLEGLQRQEFSAVNEAVDWLKRHHQGLLVGSIVVIAGVAFVTVSAGAGLVVLAPAVLLAS
ncbi:hypothetical protein [Vitiosangium sp. GDMCC 1.1324]|uniref:hypothetical protein n=1 Tax=Vitiosangium sp. (strain GDMCC 1.1324) TaxID=2138576 RepID=UPI000D3A61A2|nr:hypothetical protein [Vitiosangium sp. GDMCC 1.1324]PTL79906.1 hypothetical protein DAT35_31245 [Vitiosangium sp. GDMCC 1.1324]